MDRRDFRYREYCLEILSTNQPFNQSCSSKLLGKGHMACWFSKVISPYQKAIFRDSFHICLGGFAEFGVLTQGVVLCFDFRTFFRVFCLEGL